MLRIILTSLLFVAIAIQLVLFVLILLAIWQRDRQQQREIAVWSSITFFFIVLLLTLNPATSGFSRIGWLTALIFSVVSVIRNIRRFRNQP